jgi:menaquinone reductase, multiheme cytochrome c subunit
MAAPGRTSKFVFPRSANLLLPVLVVMVFGGAIYTPVLVGLLGSPQTLAVGYQPQQPVPYSHALHVGQLGMDCRYCHSTVEKAPFAAVPPTQVCMNCHTSILPDSPKLRPIMESAASGKPVEWTKVHNLPGYAYFNHSAHVNKGVGCVTCHGRIDQMETVRLTQPLSMSWCLDCHRAPEQHLRPLDQVTNMTWKPADGDQLKLGLELKKQYGIRSAEYMTACSTCHR